MNGVSSNADEVQVQDKTREIILEVRTNRGPFLRVRELQGGGRGKRWQVLHPRATGEQTGENVLDKRAKGHEEWSTAKGRRAGRQPTKGEKRKEKKRKREAETQH